MLRLFGKRKLDYKEYEALCIEIFKNEVIDTARHYRAVSTTYLGKDTEKRDILNARGPESIYMLTIHVLWCILEYQLRLAEGRRASDSVVKNLSKWALFAGSFEVPPAHILKENIEKLESGTSDRSSKYYNEVLNKNSRLKQVPATISSFDYLEQKAIPSFKKELAKQFAVAEIEMLDPDSVAELVSPLYRLHAIFNEFLQKNAIKRR